MVLSGDQSTAALPGDLVPLDYAILGVDVNGFAMEEGQNEGGVLVVDQEGGVVVVGGDSPGTLEVAESPAVLLGTEYLETGDHCLGVTVRRTAPHHVDLLGLLVDLHQEPGPLQVHPPHLLPLHGRHFECLAVSHQLSLLVLPSQSVYYVFHHDHPVAMSLPEHVLTLYRDIPRLGRDSEEGDGVG